MYAFALVCLLAATATAQVPLPINAGTVAKSYYTYSSSPYTYTGIYTGTSVFAGQSTSMTGGYTYAFVDQAVVVVSLSPAGSRLPSVSSAFLYFTGISSLSGTWTLWANTGSPNGTISAGDWISGSSPSGFVKVGSQSFASAGSGTLTFDIASRLNTDLGNAGQAWSSYTLTKTGALTGMTVSGSYTPQAPVPIPEPGTWALFGLGLVSLFAGRRLRKKGKATPRE
jgi:hypothetical protein